MKIKKKILESFVKESSLTGDHALLEVKLDFGEKGLKMNAIVEGNSIFVQAQIPASAFEEYSEIGKIGIINYSELNKIIGALNDDITILKEGNVLVLKGGRKIEIPLADESIIKDVDKIPKLEYSTGFVMKKEAFDDIEKNTTFAMNKDDSVNINFNGNGGKLVLRYGTKYKFEDTLEVPEIKEAITADFGMPLINAVHNLTGDLNVQIKSNFPITIVKKTDMYAIKIIVAPRT